MKFGIRKKMICGYLPVIMLIIVIAAYSAHSLNKLNSINRDIIQEDTFLIQAADKMEDAIMAQESYGRRYLILNNKLMLELFWQRNQEFNEIANRVRIIPRHEDIPVGELVDLHNEFTSLYAETEISATGPSPLATGEFDALVREKFDNMIGLLQRIKESGKQRQYQRLEDANNLGISSFRFTVLLSTLGIILALAAVFLITRNISRTIFELKRATEIIAEGKYDYCLQVDSKDELGDLAGSLRLMALRLSLLEKISLDSNPLTRLPGGMAIENILTKRLEQDRNVAFCMLDLDNFKSYNDRYGYAKGNEVIRATAAIIKAAVSEHGAKEDFVGHIGGDDFAIVTDTSRYEMICKTIIRAFDDNIPYYYNESDRQRGHIVSKNRQGQRSIFPIMSISISVVTNDQARPLNHIEMGEIAAEIKEYVKSLPGSNYIANRRELSEFSAEQVAGLKRVK